MAHAPDESPVNTCVDEALAEHFVRVDRGEHIDRDEFIRQHPDCAAELHAYFGDSEALGRFRFFPIELLRTSRLLIPPSLSYPVVQFPGPSITTKGP